LLATQAPFVEVGPATHKIQHVIIVMQENRTFDNYFWTYPGQVGYKPSLCMPYDPNLSSPCLKPAEATSTVSVDLPHDWQSTHVALNNGKMNGFLEAAGQSNEYNSKRAHDVMSYYDNSTLPNLWAYAKQYVLADRFFSSAKSYSQPNHWYMIAGNSPAVSLTEGEAQEKAACYNSTTAQLTMGTCSYINEAQDISTMADVLTQHGVSWKYYDTPVPPGYTLAQAIAGNTGGPDAFAYWNPLFTKNSTYQSYENSVVAREQFFWDLGNGTLPQVSWVIPSPGISDHPPANVTLGMWWITDIVDSVMKSKYWDNSMIVVMWDDYGGFFDTVTPPTVDGAGLSFRVPALIISPYAKKGYLDHTVLDFESTLKFIEWDFGLPSLTHRDALANNLLGAFNFNQQPRKPYIIPLSGSQLNTIAPYIRQGAPGAKAMPALQFIGNDPD